MELLERSIVVKFFRSQIIGGIFWVMSLCRSEIPVTELKVQVISGQSQGDDVEVQDWRDGGLPSCCLRFRRIVRSSVFGLWGITSKGIDRRTRRIRVTGIFGNAEASFDISDCFS